MVQQVGAPLELYHKPANLFVAGFIGSPKMNLLPVNVTGRNGQIIEIASSDVKVAQFGAGEVVADPTKGLVLGVRPQSLQLVADDSAKIPAEVRLVEHLGNETVIKAQLASGSAILVIVPGDAALSPGEKIGLTFDVAKAHLFQANGPRLVRSGETL